MLNDRKKLNEIYEAVCNEIPYTALAFRSAYAISIVSQFPYRHIQIVLRLYSSPAEILMGFDVDSCSCGFDGKQVYMTPRCHQALIRQMNTVDMTRRSPTYELRLAKYADRGFEVEVPLLQREKIDPMILRKVVKIGLPAGLQSMMYSISNVLIQANINSFGTDTIAAWAVFGKIDGLFWMTMDAMGIAITTFAGQNFGADKLDRVKRGNYVGLLMSAILTAILGGVVTILGPILSGLFTSDATVLEYSLNIIHFLVPFWFTYVCVNVFPSTLRGVGDALVPMLLVCIGTCVLRVTWIFTVGTFVHDLMVTLVSYPLSWSVTSIAFLIYYYRFSAIHKLTKLQKRSAK